jgi:hypothetical protein
MIDWATRPVNLDDSRIATKGVFILPEKQEH